MIKEKNGEKAFKYNKPFKYRTWKTQMVLVLVRELGSFLEQDWQTLY